MNDDVDDNDDEHEKEEAKEEIKIRKFFALKFLHIHSEIRTAESLLEAC